MVAKSSKNDMVLDYVQLLIIGRAFQAMKFGQNAKKWLPNHQKMKCSFLDYVQLLMIGQAFRVTKVAQNAKKWPPNHQKMKCLFLDYIQLMRISQFHLICNFSNLFPPK